MESPAAVLDSPVIDPSNPVLAGLDFEPTTQEYQSAPEAYRELIAPPPPLHVQTEGRGRRRLRQALQVAVFGGAAALALVGCTAAPRHAKASPSPSVEVSDPTDGLPLLDDLAKVGKYPDQTVINTTYLSEPVERTAINDPKVYSWYGIDQKDVGLPLGASAALLTIKLGKDGKLHVVDETGGKEDYKSTPMQNLLGAIETDETLLTGVMQNAGVTNFKVRIFEPPDPGDEYPPTQQGVYVSQDPNTNNEPTIYGYLPGRNLMDQESLATLFGHEELHAALQQGLTAGELSADEISSLTQACTTIRDQALQDIRQYDSDIITRLNTISRHVDKQYRPDIQKVIDALRHGTYGKLQQQTTQGLVPECEVQTPMQAVVNVIEARGGDVDKFVDAATADATVDDVDTMADEWQELLVTDSIYATLREAEYVPPSEDNELFGHPYSNSDETTVSFVDIAFTFPDEVARYVSSMPEPIQKAVDQIVGLSVIKLNQLYGDNKAPTLINWINTHYQAFQKARAAVG